MATSTASFDSDLFRSASHRNMILHLSGPLAAGAVESAAVVDATARVTVPGPTREPLLLLSPRAPLDASRILVEVILDPDGTATPLPALDFAPYTEAGAALPIDPLPRRRLGATADARQSPSFTVGLSLTQIAPDGKTKPVPPAAVAGMVQASVVEGILGRTVYILGAEKARLRRQARELAAMRRTATARDDALDRTGADLGIPRFADRLRYDPVTKQVVSEVRKGASGADIPEPDAEYRDRLSIYRPSLVPSRSQVLAMLNGPGADTEHNGGLLGRAGVSARVSLQEADNDFGVAILMTATLGDPFKANFLDYIRDVYLVLPLDDAATNALLAKRFIPSATRAQEDSLRASLRNAFQFPASAAVAPMLASALDRAGRVRVALAPGAPLWEVIRTQDPSGGSRFELGVGASVAPLASAELDRMVTSLKHEDFPAGTDAETLALIRSMSPRPSAIDPDGRWFLEPCGFRTTHRINADQLYLSHLPIFGMVIDALPTITHSDRLRPSKFAVRYEAPSEPGSNLVLSTGIQNALAQWTAGGGSRWTQLSADDALASWKAAGPRQAGDNALNVFSAAGLPAVVAPAAAVTQLQKVSTELLATLKLDPAQAQAILGGQPAAATDLARLVGLLRANGLTSVLPLVSGAADVVLIVAVIGLPVAGLNLSETRATGFRWYSVPITGAGGTLSAVGSRNEFFPSSPGLTAIVAVGYVRTGNADPYEVRVNLPDGALLDLTQYEFLMNLLDRIWPLGVEINTFAIRQNHVDLDGDGKADPLPPTIFRSFRQFRRPRQRGEVGVGTAPADS